MIRSQRRGNRYLAGLVVVFACLHLALTGTRAVIEPGHWIDFAVFGVAPGLVAIICGVRAWKDRGTSSWILSAVGLVILLVAMAVSHMGHAPF